ncbi:hypothetical protein ACIOHE_00610 [Streptomyces sp. NPDC087851]|uniref:hypothetical protein n=1 Tax=Streptomyces sp. NPDC087851 TaxID=3365810 RepID=UPI00380A0D7C
MFVTGAAFPAGDGAFTMGGFSVAVTEGVPRLPDGTLADSTVTAAAAGDDGERIGISRTTRLRAGSCPELGLCRSHAEHV